MLPAYYGLLRLCCQQSRALTRQLAGHQNLQWAFKNITPHPTQYNLAVDELFKLMGLFVAKYPDSTQAELDQICVFRRQTLSAYLSGLDARVSWNTLVSALRILVENEEDRLFFVSNGGLTMCFEALLTLHSMYHEATACNVTEDLQDLLREIVRLVQALRQNCREQKKKYPPSGYFKGLPEVIRRLTTLLNTFNPPEMRKLTLDVLKVCEIFISVELEVNIFDISRIGTCKMYSNGSNCDINANLNTLSHTEPTTFNGSTWHFLPQTKHEEFGTELVVFSFVAGKYEEHPTPTATHDSNEHTTHASIHERQRGRQGIRFGCREVL